MDNEDAELDRRRVPTSRRSNTWVAAISRRE